MKFSEKWLREWANPSIDTAKLSHQLTMAGLEVEVIEAVAPEHEGVVIGKILQAEKHPDADKLQVCLVDVGAMSPEPLHIVCGAPNARKNLLVACAMVKAKLPGDFKIKKSKIRGVESYGMLCSEKELGLADDHAGIMELPGNAPLGVTLKEYLQLDDNTIELGLTPNRGDCLSVAGIARDTSVITNCDFKFAEIKPQPTVIDDKISISISAPEQCPRYVGRIIKNVDVNAETPLWMQERLRRSGQNSISPLVDVTNYVMLELGQPMHAFDLDKISGQINVRMAFAGEKLNLLDGQEISLNTDNLVIADEQQALALAGIMGGASSAVTETTRNILLESAFFTPDAIIGKARSHALRTESSHRFERGVSPALQEQAIERATQFIVEIAGGDVGAIVFCEKQEYVPKPKRILFKREKIGRVLGIQIEDEKVAEILKRLEMTVESCDEGWYVTPPVFRFDITIDADLLEEIARIYGYENLPLAHSSGSIKMTPAPENMLVEKEIKNILVALGYQEAITYSFVEPEMQSLITPDLKGLKLSNPISDELSTMRTSLWSGLIQTLVYNQNRQQTRIRLFEVGSCFIPQADGLIQENRIAGIATGSALPEQWGETSRQLDYYDLKADVETLLSLGRDLSSYRFEADEHPALHPGQTARIYKEDKPVGWLGMLHPAVAKILDVKTNTILFELEMSAVSIAKVPKFKNLSKFPAIRRDLAIIVGKAVNASAIITSIRESAGDSLTNVQLFDVYTGEGIETDKKSLALGLTLQEQSRTLTDEEVDSLIKKVLVNLKQHHQARLRD